MAKFLVFSSRSVEPGYACEGSPCCDCDAVAIVEAGPESGAWRDQYVLCGEHIDQIGDVISSSLEAEKAFEADRRWKMAKEEK